VRAAVPLVRRTATDRVRLLLSADRSFTTPQLNEHVFAVRRARIDVNPRRYYAYGDALAVMSGPEFPVIPSTSSAAVRFPVPLGSTIRRFSVSMRAFTGESSFQPTARVWVRFPDGSRSLMQWWWNNDVRSAEYHLAFAEGPPVGTTAVGDFSIELESSTDTSVSTTVYPWFAELLID
jgi:hypothetical protein